MTTRHGGVSSGPYASLNLGLHVGDEADLVLENRRRAAAVLGAAPGDVVWAAQPHGPAAAVVTAADRGRGAFSGPGAGAGPGGRLAVPDADALVTADPAAVLAILVADCVPIVLHDPVARVLACVHAGWRGTVARVTDAALAAMASLGARPADVRAGLGPAIGPDRYQVGDDVAGPARETLGGDADRVLRPDGTGRWLLDLPGANALLLAAAGVPAGQIYPAGEADRRRRAVLQSPGLAARGPVRPAGTTSARTAAVSAQAPYSYQGFDLDPSRGLLTCRYEAGGREFAERVGFDPGGRWDAPGVRAAARLVFLLAGVSYYKTTAAPVIDLGETAVTSAERDFLRSFYLDGLGEFAYRNGLDLSGLEIVGPVSDEPARAAGPAPDGRRTAVPGGRWCRSAAASTRSSPWRWSATGPTPRCSSWGGRTTGSPRSRPRPR